MLNSLSSLFKSSSSVNIDRNVEKDEIAHFQKSLDFIKDKFKGVSAEISLAQISDSTWLSTFFKDYLPRENMQQRKTYTFGRENESILGQGILSIPLQSSSSEWAIVASGLGIKVFQSEAIVSDVDARCSEIITQYLEMVKDLLKIDDVSSQTLGQYADQVTASTSEIPNSIQPQILSCLGSVCHYYHASLQKQTIVDVLLPPDFQKKRILEWDIMQRILEKHVSTIWAPPPRSSSLFLKEETDLLQSFGTDKQQEHLQIKYEFSNPKYRSMNAKDLELKQATAQLGRVKEVLESEQKFITYLKYLDKAYNQPILNEGEANGLPSHSFVNSLVVPVGNLIQSHEKFLKSCLKGEKNALNVADSFVECSHQLEMALNQYCIEQVQSDLHINKNQSKEFKSYLRKLEDELVNQNPQVCVDLSFKSLRGQPIQRVTRYAILFKDMLETINPQDVETHAAVTHAYQKACSLATKVNMSQREGDAQKFIFQTTLANKFKIPIRGNSSFITDVKITEAVSHTAKSHKWVLLFSSSLIVLSGNPKTFEREISLQELQLQQYGENDFTLYQEQRGTDKVKYLYSLSDTLERNRAFLKYLRHHILMQTELRNDQSDVNLYAEHYGQLDFYYRTLSSDTLNTTINPKNRGDVLMIILDDSDYVENSLEVDKIHYDAVFAVQILPNSFNYSFCTREVPKLSFSQAPKLKEKEIKGEMLLALKNATLLKVLNEINYAERDYRLLRGYITSTTEQISLSLKKPEDRVAHNRKATESSIGSSILSLSKSVKNGIMDIGRSFSIKRGAKKSLYAESIRTGNGSPAASITSFQHKPTPEKKMGIRSHFNHFLSKSCSLENLQSSYTDTSTALVDYLCAREFDIRSRYEPTNLIADLLKGQLPGNLSAYSTKACLDALKSLTLSHDKLFFGDKTKSKISLASQSASLDSELVPFLVHVIGDFKKEKKERFSKFLFNLKRLSQKSQLSWWPEKDIAYFFHPVLLKGSDRFAGSTEDAENARRALDCLIFHHDSNNEKAISEKDTRDDSSIVGETFLTSSFVQATKVTLPEYLQFVYQEYLEEDVHHQITEFSSTPLLYCQDNLQDIGASSLLNAFKVSISLALEDPFSMIPYVINVFNAANILTETVTIYHGEKQVEDTLLPLNFVDLFRKPLLSDDTMASLTFAIEPLAQEALLNSTKDEYSKPFTLATIAEAGKTFTSLADLESELDLILD